MMMPPRLVCRTHSFPRAFTDGNYKTAAKGRFIHDMGLAGFVMWEAGGDYDSILLDAIRSGMGLASC